MKNSLALNTFCRQAGPQISVLVGTRKKARTLDRGRLGVIGKEEKRTCMRSKGEGEEEKTEKEREKEVKECRRCAFAQTMRYMDRKIDR